MVVAEQVGEVVREVRLDELREADDNARGEVGDVAALAVSIRAQGLVQPIVAVDRGDHLLVVAGARRLAAAKLAGLDTVPVLVRDLDEPARYAAMLVENLQRADLSPLEEARAYARLLELEGIGQRELASRVGRTQPHISKRLALLKLPDEVAARIDAGHRAGLPADRGRAGRPRPRPRRDGRRVVSVLREQLAIGVDAAGVRHAIYPTASRALCGDRTALDVACGDGLPPPDCAVCAHTAEAFDRIDHSAPAGWYRPGDTAPVGRWAA